MYLKTGPYGPYIQLGEMVDGKKPKMASLLPGTAPADVTIDYAIKLLSLPRNLGEHPELKQNIIVSNGRFGPYIKCGDDTRSIPLDTLSPLEMTLNDAVELLKQPKGRGRGAKPKTLRELGAHPGNQKPLVIMSGRYGPYVSDGEINASLPKEMPPETLTVEQAVSLLEARAQRLADEPPRKKRRGSGGKAKGSKKAKASDEASA
jgi:DNA topoisomerase I